MSELQPGQKGYTAQQKELFRQEFQDHATIDGVQVTLSKRGRLRISIPTFQAEEATLFTFTGEDARRFYRIGVTAGHVRMAITAAAGIECRLFYPTKLTDFEVKTDEDEEISECFNDLDNLIRATGAI